jgi:hypothetical protein
MYLSGMRVTMRASRVVLAATVLLLVAIEFVALSLPYPAHPTVGSVPVAPELLAPALLGVFSIVGALRDGIGVGSIATGLLGLLTVWVATTSLYESATAAGGGLAWGAFFTLFSGAVLAVLGRQPVRRTEPGVLDRLGTQFGQ